MSSKYTTKDNETEVMEAFKRWALKDHRGDLRSRVISKTELLNVGKALRKIRDQNLYRETHNNFYEYCAERWGLLPDRVHWYMDYRPNVISTSPEPDVISPKKNSFIYFLSGGDLIKIGYTINISSRINAIRCMSPIELTLLGFIPGNRKLEQSIHQKFNHLRHHGEWFYFTQEIATFIELSLRHE